jgi:hypothetical protein
MTRWNATKLTKAKYLTEKKMTRVFIDSLQHFSILTPQVRYHPRHFWVAVFTPHVVGRTYGLLGTSGNENKKEK